jgi:hypothetical protein
MKTVVAIVAVLSFARVGYPAVATVPCTADTTLQEMLPDSNMGGLSFVAAGAISMIPDGFQSYPINRGLFRFDLVGYVASGATITSAKFHIYLGFYPPGPGSTFQLHRVRKAWGEGDKIGFGRLAEAATEGEATWNAPMHPGPRWAASGASSDEDAALVISSSVAITNIGWYTFASTPALAADVQSWVDSPASNFGWLFRSASESTGQTARRFASRASGFFAPTLEITYETNLVRIVEVRRESTALVIRWSGGHPPYRLQRADAPEGPYEFVTPAITNLSATTPFQGATAYYRVASELP